MPGGSVNGRPFREDVDSYERTGIPCGNPKRYQSRSVVRMAPHTQQTAKLQPLDAPQEEIQTEADRQLKRLLDNQMKTDISMKDYLKKHKTFSEGVKFNPPSAEAAGQFSLSQYRDLTTKDEQTEQLRQCGLTDDEIQYKLEADGLQPSRKNSKYGIDPLAHQAYLERINQKIQHKQDSLAKKDTFSGAKFMTRHEMELEKSLTQDRDKNINLQCLMTTEESRTKDFDAKDPINDLHSMLEKITKGKSNLMKSKSHKDDTDDMKIIGPEIESKESQEASIRGNIDDVIESIGTEGEDKHAQGSPTTKNTDVADSGSDSDPGVPTVPNRPPGWKAKEDPVVEIPESVIVQYRLSVEEIREMDRFKNYSPGEPSKTLYLKNLGSKVTERDLASLFIRYQTPEAPRIIFKLMEGRMRGQAFVTFDSQETASKALDLVNGYNFKGKPVIIQYGKKS